MTIEIIYLTAQIQRWLNARVALILEAQAAPFGTAERLIRKGSDHPSRRFAW